MKGELPQGWAESTVGECFLDLRNGTTAPQNTEGKGLPVSRIETIQGGRFDLSRVRYLETLSREAIENFRYRYGDIAFSHINSYEHAGKTALYDGNPETFIHGMNLLRLRLGHDQIEPQFAYLFMQTTFFREEVRRRVGHAVNQVSINQKSLTEVPFVIAPLAEQQRITLKLGKLLSQVDACQHRLAKVPVLLKRFRQSVLAAACSGRLTADWREANPNIEPTEGLGDGEPPSDYDLPKTWSWLRSSHAFGFVTSGSRGWARYYSDDGALFLRVGNLNHDGINLDLRSIQRVSPPATAEGRRTKVLTGDILISITADVGMIALIRGGLEEAYINQHIALARPTGNVERKYLAYFLAAKSGGQEQFLNLQRGATKVGLGLDDIRSIWIAHPPLPEQQEIVRRVENLFALADRIESRCKAGRKSVDGISQAILAKAFRGELVPAEYELAKAEGRSFESAEELLARIRAANGTRSNGNSSKPRKQRSKRK